MKRQKFRHQRIKDFVENVFDGSVRFLKKGKKNMPYKNIEALLKIYFPKTKDHEAGNGAFKHVYVIHSRNGKRILVLKVGRKKAHVNKDYKTYLHMFRKTKNKYFAKIYWKSGLFMLQRYGEKANKIPPKVFEKLREKGKECGLSDIKEDNIRKFGTRYLIVDAERKRRGA